jgi:hypothetical protein
MINSTTSTDRAVHPEAVNPKGPAAVRPVATRPDQLSTENAVHLREALARQPEIRTEVVERAQKLAADENYPSIDVLRQVGVMILTSADLSDAQP